MSIAEIEQWAQDQSKNAFLVDGKSTLKQVSTVPGRMTMQLLKTMVAKSPAIYWFWKGGNAVKGGDTGINSTLIAYCVSRNARGHAARRNGGTQEIGVYDMIEVLIPAIHKQTIPEVGSVYLKDVNNLFTVQLEKDLGAALYAVSFSVPTYFEARDVAANLSHFETFHADIDIEPLQQDQHQNWLGEDHTETPDAQVTEQLEQP